MRVADSRRSTAVAKVPAASTVPENASRDEAEIALTGAGQLAGARGLTLRR